jgi:formylglycine-generating enzyme required for sulfatase activity
MREALILRHTARPVGADILRKWVTKSLAQPTEDDYDPNCAPPDDDLELPTGSSYGCPTKPAQSLCVSSSGAFDMSGNLKEWTSTQIQPGAFNIRGGGYDTPAGGLSCQFDFVSADPSFLFANLGFRCCSDPP